MKYGIYIIIFLMLIGCGNVKVYTEQDMQAFQSLQDMIRSKNFEIESNFARPMASVAFMQVANTNILGLGNSANQINISSNSNKLTMKGDTISGYLPYFGEVRFGGGYPGANHQGIEFKNVPEDYKVTVNDKKNSVNINFRMRDQYRTNEQYNVFITLFPNKSSTIQINSSNRTSIEYSGSAKPLESPKDI